MHAHTTYHAYVYTENTGSKDIVGTCPWASPLAKGSSDDRATTEPRLWAPDSACSLPDSVWLAVWQALRCTEATRNGERGFGYTLGRLCPLLEGQSLHWSSPKQRRERRRRAGWGYSLCGPEAFTAGSGPFRPQFYQESFFPLIVKPCL
ncbi:hypothetical protein HJG60_012119 [Phyllostomus discolor]|uniref:Uncharacterized protein n=1 Tax=Phyllostomus discolor TaxID=89673 RepID=A0A834DYS1_9CHIR|nr:hypothetical protein HJG60_012119 [Phyllostomus discolor]